MNINGFSQVFEIDLPTTFSILMQLQPNSGQSPKVSTKHSFCMNFNEKKINLSKTIWRLENDQKAQTSATVIVSKHWKTTAFILTFPIWCSHHNYCIIIS